MNHVCVFVYNLLFEATRGFCAITYCLNYRWV